MTNTPKPAAPQTRSEMLTEISRNRRPAEVRERVAIATARGTVLSRHMAEDEVEKILDEIEEGITNPEYDEATGNPLPEIYLLPVPGNREQRIVLAHVITFGYANPHTDN